MGSLARVILMLPQRADYAITYYYYYYYYIITTTTTTTTTISRRFPPANMSKAKTKEFVVAREIDVASTAGATELVDLSAYVDPGDNQGVEILAVDFLWYNKSTYLPMDSTTNFEAAVQVKDNTEGALITPESIHLIASAGYSQSASNVYRTGTDVFPDILPGEGRVVVNDALEIVSDNSNSIGNFACCVRITMRIVKLTKRDWMQIALQTVADN